MCNSHSVLDECVLTIDEPSDDCTICLESVDNRSDYTIRLYCKHVYHIHCYKEYVKHARQNGDNLLRCPVCRDVLEDLYYTSRIRTYPITVYEAAVPQTTPTLCSAQLILNCAVCVTLVAMLAVVGVYWSRLVDSN